MIEEDTYCDDALKQLASAQSALNRTALYLQKLHVKQCVSDQLKNGNTDAIAEVIKQ
ncbi:MAG: metal-sensing transcriptional repressor [Spirochaetes bacterium]|nr:metal-sensing transcriptional repressor [Spirochaetota bacterium]